MKAFIYGPKQDVLNYCLIKTIDLNTKAINGRTQFWEEFKKKLLLQSERDNTATQFNRERK